MSGGVWHQFISMRDHPNQSFYLEGHSSSAETVMDVGDDDNNDNDDKKMMTMTLIRMTIMMMTMVKMLPWGTLVEY